ncbi:ABC transporter substrate-binding protein [Cupriavidus necator]|uniref:ABC transporter substrate-binding protein n=1 Tax=Cupriavidus necator TaxID=106590 RepID=A0A1U9UN65_CUPNE|nr:tripartite tricarboxylate transporter substrate-binding protein [Cupriavidus necator]AQV94040.1 ABC transporter substrate-binding protein [Cupriavidus necator]
MKALSGFAHALILALLTGSASVALAQGSVPVYPGAPVKIYVGFAAGGGTDLLTRYYAKRLGEKLGQPFIVENKPGNGGGIAVQATVQAPPNGYTLVTGMTGIAIDAALGKSQYDWQRDLAPIAPLGASPNVLVVSSKSSMRTVADVIREARSGPLTFGSAGFTTTMHMSGELFKHLAGVDMVHVPYRGQAPAELALLTGEIDLLFDNIAGAAPYLASGKFRAIAFTSLARNPAYPDIPTVDESGLKGFETTGTTFLMAPARTPPAMLKTLEKATEEISQEPATRALLKQMHLMPLSGGSQTVASYLAAEYRKWQKLAGVKGLDLGR